MALYGKTSKQLLVDLINQANPSLPFPIDDINFDFQNVAAITPTAEGHDTQVRVTAKQSSMYTGSVVLTYTRLNISYLLRNVTPQVQRWIANTGMNATVLLSSDALLPLYSDKYGINLEVGQWGAVNLTGYNGVRGDTWTLTANPDNLCYTGSTPMKWLIGERTLDNLLAVSDAPGRLYPDGNNFAVTQRYWVQPDGFDADYTSVKAYLENTFLANAVGYVGYKRTNGTVNPYVYTETASSDFINNVLPLVTRRGGGTYGATPAGGLATGYKTTDFTLDGCKFARYTLPHPDVPEANSEFFNRLVVVQIPDDCPWGTGDLYFHYNV